MLVPQGGCTSNRLPNPRATCSPRYQTSPASSGHQMIGSCSLPPMLERRRPDGKFSELYTQPTYSPVYAALPAPRHAAQNSGPSGSPFLPHADLSFSASYRFIPANNHLCFHQHPLRPIITPAFSSTSSQARKPPFSFVFVFNDIQASLVKYRPPFFCCSNPS